MTTDRTIVIGIGTAASQFVTRRQWPAAQSIGICDGGRRHSDGDCIALEYSRYGSGLDEWRTGLAEKVVQDATPKLMAMMAGARTTILVAGLGGEIGSTVTPLVAKVLHDAGIAVAGVVSRPFPFEGQRVRRRAQSAIERLPIERLTVIDAADIYGRLGLRATFVDFFKALDSQMLVAIVAQLAPTEATTPKSE